MPEEVVVRYRWTLAEVTTASRWHLRQNSRMLGIRVFCWGMAALCGLSAAVEYRRPGTGYFALWLLGAVYFLSLPTLRRRLTLGRMRRNYLKSTGQDSEVEWRITEVSLRTQATHGSSEVTWAAFNKAVQTPDGLLLYRQPMLFHWFPKTGANQEEFGRLAGWARSKLPDFRQVS